MFWIYVNLVCARWLHFFTKKQLLNDYDYEYEYDYSKALKRIWFLLHLKSSCLSRVIFCFFWVPSYFTFGHWFRGWEKIKTKVFNVISYLNNNSITYFVWYLVKDKRYDIKTLSVERVSNNTIFSGKIMQNVCTKS